MRDDEQERGTSAIRPYVITKGRSGVSRDLPWETLVIASGVTPPATLQPEYLRIVERCRGLLSVAEIAAHLGQPPPVVQVLLADLIEWGLVETRPPVPPARHADVSLLRKVLHGLESRL
ncbi:DUF742 domain-containing protein [Streptomyces sp. CNQ085]|uniref:DUF742 domain-containing protein n=1 Tax=Streptomyces sp. CNQ085 TaxID=2886944 RepID=UPI001F50E311|nr:DUF742 domain-containing protein [Streptomyces sp. CNQ085]MCI0383319.1 DUF742 domain-containing protein [Streptomyces sp. CNQ085]